jgi:hypothetical protein
MALRIFLKTLSNLTPFHFEELSRFGNEIGSSLKPEAKASGSFGFEYPKAKALGYFQNCYLYIIIQYRHQPFFGLIYCNSVSFGACN